MKIVALMILMLTALTAYAETIIVNLGVSSGKREVVMSREVVTSVFLSRRHYFENGLKVKVFVLPKDNLATRDFLRHLGISPSQYFDGLSSQYASGKENVPTVLDSEAMLVVKVNAVVGATGYVGNVDLLSNTSYIKIVVVE